MDHPSVPRPAVLVLGTSFALVARLRRAFGEDVELVCHARIVDAIEVLASRPLLGVLVEPADARGTLAAPLVVAARRIDASLPVFGIVSRAAGWSPATVALIEAHPTVVAVEEDLDLVSVARVLSSRLWQSVMVARIWPQLAADVPEPLRPLVRAALARASAPLSVGDVADALGLHRKTLWSQCRRHGAGSAQEMMTWCRLLAAAHALGRSARPIDAIAEDLAFASPTALRNAIRRHLGTTASALRAGEGERIACEGFRQWLRAASPAASAAGSPHGVTMSDVA